MERIEPRQFETLSRIVSIPSPYSQVEPASDETALQDAIWEMLQDGSIRTSKQTLSESSDRYNIIAQKGAPIEDAKYVIMVYVHTDTIKKKESWKDAIDYKLVRDGEFLRGVGAYDMKAGVMMLIDLLQMEDIPEGVTLVGAFCCGEERDSDGIKKLMEWPHIRKVKKVLCPEIGSMGNDEADDSIMLEKDDPKSIIVARPGNFKSLITVTAGDSHAYKTNAPDANDAWSTMRCHLKEQFGSRVNGALREHPDLLREFMRFRHETTIDSDGGEFESLATGFRAKMAIRIVPPTSVAEMQNWLQDEMLSCMEAEQWGDFGLSAEPSRFGTSYNPYVVRTDSSAVQAVAKAAQEHYGASILSPGQAVADSALGHWEMNEMRGLKPQQFNQFAIGTPRTPDDPIPDEYVPWLDIGPLGQGAHKKTERVYEASLVKLIDFYRFYITQYLPRYLEEIGA